MWECNYSEEHKMCDENENYGCCYSKIYYVIIYDICWRWSNFREINRRDVIYIIKYTQLKTIII